jgi:hypothetical protein
MRNNDIPDDRLTASIAVRDIRDEKDEEQSIASARLEHDGKRSLLRRKEETATPLCVTSDPSTSRLLQVDLRKLFLT